MQEDFTGSTDFCIIQRMEPRISAAELLRTLDNILGKVYAQGDSFLIERNGDPMARIVPLPEKFRSSLREALAAWCGAGPPEPAFADDLERVGAADRPAEDVWA